MARSKFNMGTVVQVADPVVAAAMVAKEKNPQYHHTLLLKQVVELAEPITCKDLYDWLESQKALLMTEEGVKTWDKYSAACHMAYFINRCRGAIKAEVDGVAVVQTATKVKKVKAEVKAEEPAEPAEASTPEEEAVEEALA
jgi:hypothetical protein